MLVNCFCQMTELEVTKLSLMDQVQSLEQQIFFLQQTQTDRDQKDFVAMSAASDLCLSKLDEQLAEAQAQVKKTVCIGCINQFVGGIGKSQKVQFAYGIVFKLSDQRK